MTPTENPPQPSSPIENEQSFSDELKKCVEKLISSQIDEEAKFEKQWQFLRLQKADLYYRGLQYIAPQINNLGFVQYSPIGGVTSALDDTGSSVYDYDIDQIRSLGRKFIAVLGQRSFQNVAFMPRDPNSEKDRVSARQAAA